MDNPDLREMIDLATANRLVGWTAMACLATALAGLLAALPCRGARGSLLRAAAAVAPAGFLIAVGWDLYLWRVRFDPETGFCGLHSVSVLAGNVLAAVVVGLLYGLYLRWLWGLPLQAAPVAQSQSEED